MKNPKKALAVGALVAAIFGLGGVVGASWASSGKTAAPSAAPASGSAASTPAPPASAAPHGFNAIPSLASVRAMDDIDMASLDRFWEKWTLVNVRYRTDNGEQRFIYANDLAWKTLQARGKSFPDGAMLGKIAFKVSNDPAFPSSLEPDSFGRLQIMKKDAAHYKSTDGWGYAVVVANTREGDSAEDVSVAAACHACHKLVADRDFVFARTPFSDREAAPGHDLKARFKAMAVSELAAGDQKVLTKILGRSPGDSVHYLSMPMFSGSADESMPIIVKFATADRSAYLLSDPQSGHFVGADGTPLQGGAGGCQPGTRVAVTTARDPRALTPDAVKFGSLCGDSVTWTGTLTHNKPK